MWVQIPPEAAHIFFEKRESELSQLVVLCKALPCLMRLNYIIIYKKATCTPESTKEGEEREIIPILSLQGSKAPCKHTP